MDIIIPLVARYFDADADADADTDVCDVELACVLSAFGCLVAEWNLDDDQVDALLFVGSGYWRAFSAAARPSRPSAGCERRMRRCLEVDAALNLGLRCGSSPRDWLRHPAGRRHRDVLRGYSTPLAALTGHPAVLGTMRDLFSSEI